MSQLFSLRNYKKNSIIYFENDVANEIFILRNGRVSLMYDAIHNDKATVNIVKLGEFFGIKSTIGSVPHEETARAEVDSSVIVVKIEDFAQFVENKPEVIIKMMKNFSGQLRKVHQILATLPNNLENTSRSNPMELFNLGEMFHKEKNFSHAIYVYNVYQNQYPNGKNLDRVKELLDLAKDEMIFIEENLPDIIEES